MKLSRKKILNLIDEIEAIRKSAKSAEKKFAAYLARVHSSYQTSAVNLVHYLALRRRDLRELQDELGLLGVSRLGRAESHVMASLLAIRQVLQQVLKTKDSKAGVGKAPVSVKQGKKLLRKHTTALLGKKLKGSKAHIMVTLPPEAAGDKQLVHELVASGMSCARINCAHDDEAAWLAMIENIQRARRKTGRNCRICMDLAGPKLRTGAMTPGPPVIHLQPRRDILGRVTAPARVWLAPPELAPPLQPGAHLPVATDWLRRLKTGVEIHFKDARDKRCKLTVVEADGKGCWLDGFDSAYVVPGTTLQLNGEHELTTQVGDLPSTVQSIALKIGDTLVLHADPAPGEPAERDPDGRLLRPAHISCTLPEVFQHLHPGEPILLDDGKIEGVIATVAPEQIQIEITYARDQGSKLRADKGINFPESQLQLNGLTAKDRSDLKFVAQHADLLNLSFVNGPQDVPTLLRELQQYNTRQLGVILKIETQRGYKNLPAILLAAMRTHPVGVMIARGDLAVEVGWRNLAGIQQEIMRLCEAAHVPVIWATQVLETMAKKGRPSRAEISDAALAQQAECVMLNKGPYILQVVHMLNDILTSMEDYHQKTAPMMPVLKALRKLDRAT